jgi:cell wall-associated NlpC family hydrolase
MDPAGVVPGRPAAEGLARGAVVREALKWIGTPYHHEARVMGAGVDCGMLLAEVYEGSAVTPHIVPDSYPHDWHMHRSEERYLAVVERFAHKIDTPPLPGDIALFRYGRCISHGGIVVEWPTIIHSYVSKGVLVENVEQNADLADRLAGFWSVWGE